MAKRENIKSQFSDLGFEVPDKVVDKCVELCILYNVDEEEFVDSWAAYSVTNLNGEAPTVDTLAQMERRELANREKVGPSSNKVSSHQSSTPLTIYNRTPTSNKNRPGDGFANVDTTPKSRLNGGQHLSTQGPRSTFSPASFSPISTTPSGKYSARSNAGNTVCEFVERTPGDWKGKDKVPLTITPYRDSTLTTRCRLMMEPLSERAAVLNDVIERIGSHLVEMNCLQEPKYTRLGSTAEVVCVGRVVCDSTGHLNPSSVLLEGSRATCLGETVPLDLSRLPSFHLFPGQVVAVVGTNPTGKRFIVSKLFHSAPLPSPPYSPTLTGTIQLVVAVGPFTPADSLDYEPLQDLVAYCRTHKPHVLLLVGPLVDLRQPQLATGNIAESYDTYFEHIVNSVREKLKGSWTQVVVVSSCHDAACLPVYPTPPPLAQSASLPLHLVSDPCLLSINGLVIAVTATDSLMHIGKEEISFPAGGSDRLGRLASHLLQQQSLYPLSPPSSELVVDCDLWDCHASLPVTPHILVVPSQFRYFIKHLQGCLVVNPEYLSKGTAGGTFARLEVDPPTDNAWSPSTHISAQIVKI